MASEGPRWDIAGAHQKLLQLKDELGLIFFPQLGNKVKTGPFEGMEIIQSPYWNDGNNISKLVGCYEYEIHSAIERAIERRPATIINVGCAEGYYAIGFARRLPGSAAIAFD